MVVWALSAGVLLFPGSGSDTFAFWESLRAGEDSISPVPLERWDVDALRLDDLSPNVLSCVRAAGFITGADLFDHRMFGILLWRRPPWTLNSACCWRLGYSSLHQAGYDWERLQGSDIGVFVGLVELQKLYCFLSDIFGDWGCFQSCRGSSAMAAGRVSFAFGLHGACMSIDTACSSSLGAFS